MIEVLIPTQKEFEKYDFQVRKLYEKNQDKIKDSSSYEFVRNNTLFYLFLKNKCVIGVIYYFMIDEKLFLNAFSNRKTFNENLYCLNLSLSWFKTNVYAEAQNRASALCLLRCGFKRVKDNLFVFEQDYK